MENKPSPNRFQEVHAKIKVAKGKLRKAGEATPDVFKKDPGIEAIRESSYVKQQSATVSVSPGRGDFRDSAIQESASRRNP